MLCLRLSSSQLSQSSLDIASRRVNRTLFYRNRLALRDHSSRITRDKKCSCLLRKIAKMRRRLSRARRGTLSRFRVHRLPGSSSGTLINITIIYDTNLSPEQRCIARKGHHSLRLLLECNKFSVANAPVLNHPAAVAFSWLTKTRRIEPDDQKLTNYSEQSTEIPFEFYRGARYALQFSIISDRSVKHRCPQHRSQPFTGDEILIVSSYENTRN